MKEFTGGTSIEWTWEHDDEDKPCDFTLDIDFEAHEEDDGTAHDYIRPRVFTVYNATQIYCDDEEAQAEARALYFGTEERYADPKFIDFINEGIEANQ